MKKIVFLCLACLVLSPTLVRLQPTSKWNENGEHNFARAWQRVVENAYGWWNRKSQPTHPPTIEPTINGNIT